MSQIESRPSQHDEGSQEFLVVCDEEVDKMDMVLEKLKEKTTYTKVLSPCKDENTGKLPHRNLNCTAIFEKHYNVILVIPNVKVHIHTRPYFARVQQICKIEKYFHFFLFSDAFPDFLSPVVPEKDQRYG